MGVQTMNKPSENKVTQNKTKSPKNELNEQATSETRELTGDELNAASGGILHIRKAGENPQDY